MPWLLAMVTFVTIAAPVFANPPPAVAELPLNVDEVKVSVAPSSLPTPPPFASAVLAERVDAEIVAAPELSMPPPEPVL